MNRRTATVRNNAIGSILVKGWGVIVSLILVPMTMDYLSPEVYGVWLTLSSIVLCLTFFDIGFTNGLKNKLAEALAAGDIVRGKALLSTAYALMLAIFLPLGLLLEIAVPFVDWCRLLNVAPSLAPQLVAAMRILLFCFALQMIFNTITAVLAACQRTAVSSVFPVVANTLSVLIIYILTRTTPPSLVALAQAIAYLPAIVLLLASLILFRTRYRALAPSPACVDRTAVAALFSLGLKFFLLQIHYVVMYQATNIIISNLSSPQQVTVYNVAYKYLSVGMLAVAIIMNPLWPAFTDAYAKGDYPWMRRTYRTMRRLVGAVMAISAFMVAVAPFVYRLWIGNASFVPWAMTLSVGAYVVIRCWTQLHVMLINGIGAIRLQTFITILGLAAYLALAFAGGHIAGAVGVVWAMTAVDVMYAVVFTIQLRKLLAGVKNTLWNR